MPPGLRPAPLDRRAIRRLDECVEIFDACVLVDHDNDRIVGRTGDPLDVVDFDGRTSTGLGDQVRGRDRHKGMAV